MGGRKYPPGHDKYEEQQARLKAEAEKEVAEAKEQRDDAVDVVAEPVELARHEVCDEQVGRPCRQQRPERHLASAVFVPYKLTRFCARDPVALVGSCQRSSLWLLSKHQREPLRRCWIDHPYGEEEITRLEDELLPAMESFLVSADIENWASALHH
jgi:hypothetical protein